MSKGDRVGEIIGDFIIIGRKGVSHSLRWHVQCRVCGRTQYTTYSVFKGRNNTHGNICSKLILREKRNKGLIKEANYWRFYRIWLNMKNRCQPEYIKKHCYYDKGICCDDYKYFVDFYDEFYESYQRKCNEIGEKNTTLDRIDNSKGYIPGNCRWASWDEQAVNKDSILNFMAIDPNGKRFYGRNLKSFCEKKSLNYNSIIQGIHQGNKSWKNQWFFKVY